MAPKLREIVITGLIGNDSVYIRFPTFNEATLRMKGSNWIGAIVRIFLCSGDRWGVTGVPFYK
jgi:hypothetical protein